MKRWVIRYVVLGLILCCTGTTTARDYFPFVYIDPGHGGPNADMTHNGDSAGGCEGPGGTAEQWINLKVALVLRDTLIARGWPEGSWWLMSRQTDTTSKTLRDRVAEANEFEVLQYISIHHNGFGAGSVQATEALWCDTGWTTDSVSRPPEARLDTLARKIKDMIRLEFNKLYPPSEVAYGDRCPSMENPNCLNCNKWITKNAMMANTISEASDISGHADEEALFVDSTSGHREDEAYAILQGWLSYCSGQGFGRLEYRYMNEDPDDSLQVWVDGRAYDLPYERTWPIPFGEACAPHCHRSD